MCQTYYFRCIGDVLYLSMFVGCLVFVLISRGSVGDPMSDLYPGYIKGHRVLFRFIHSVHLSRLGFSSRFFSHCVFSSFLCRDRVC